MCPKAEFLRDQDDQFSYPIIVHILLDPLSDMCHNNDSRQTHKAYSTGRKSAALCVGATLFLFDWFWCSTRCYTFYTKKIVGAVPKGRPFPPPKLKSVYHVP